MIGNAFIDAAPQRRPLSQSRWVDGTVTGTSPLFVRLDGYGEVPQSPTKPPLNGDVSVGDRVLCLLYGKQLIVFSPYYGTAGGNAVPLVYNVKDFKAKGDGTTNDRGAIQAAMNAAGIAGGGTIYFPPGIYRVNGTVQLASNVYITGRGATIKKSTGDGNYCVFVGLAGSATGYGTGASNVTLDNLRFQGDLANGVSINALSLHRSSNVRVQNCQFIQAVQAGHVIDLMACDDVIVDGCEFLGSNASSGREYTEYIQADSSMRIGVGWAYDDFPAEVFDGLPSKNVTVQNSVFGPLTVGGTTYPSACPFGTHTYTNGTYMHGLRFLNNKVSNVTAINGSASYYAMLHFTGCRDVAIEGNTFDAAGKEQTAIRFYRGAGGVTAGTVGDGSPTTTNTNPSVPQDVLIRGNTFVGFTHTGTTYSVMEVYGFDSTNPARNIIIEGNKFRDNFPSGDVTGSICPRMVDGSNIHGITITGNEASRVRYFSDLRSCHGVNVANNGVNLCATTPMVFDACYGLAFSGNTVRGWSNPVTFTSCRTVSVNGNAFYDPFSQGPLGARAFLTTGGDGVSFMGNVARCGVSTTASAIRCEGGTTRVTAVGNSGMNYQDAISVDGSTTLAYSAGNVT